MDNFEDLIIKAFGCKAWELRQMWGLTGGEYDTNNYYNRLLEELHRKHYDRLDHLNDDEYKWLEQSIKSSIDGLTKNN